MKSLLQTSRRALQRIDAQRQSHLLTQYSTALQRSPAYEEQRANFDLSGSTDGGFALYATVAQPLRRYVQGGSTSELVVAYRQANHVRPVLQHATRSSQGTAGTLEESLDQNLRAYRKTLGLFQNVVAEDLSDRSLEPSRCTK